MKITTFLLSLLSLFAFFCSFTFAQEKVVKRSDILEVKLTKVTDENVEAKISNLSEEAKKVDLDKVVITGKKTKTKPQNEAKAVTNIEWNQVLLKDNSAKLTTPYQSKVVENNNLTTGDSLKAKGDHNGLLEALQRLSSKPTNIKSSDLSKKSVSGAPSGNDGFSATGSTSSRLSTISSLRKSAASIASTTTGAETTATSGCTPRVDYQLNKVFIQERKTIDGKEVQSCKDSATSYALRRDYASCPKSIDTTAKKIFHYFQYFYLGENDSKNLVDSCQVDSSKTSVLDIAKSYTCPDYIDYNSKLAYAQYKQTYKDFDRKDILLADCTPDHTKSYALIEDLSTCGIKHVFDQNYSIQQSKLTYTKDGSQVALQDCKDTTKRYSHSITTETCSPIINNNQITILNRKYITVDGVRQYISECAPQNSNVEVKSENCTTRPFTHDFAANQSFRNKNYFYLDSNSARIDISSCIQSTESFQHAEDTSVCSDQNDDTKLQTIVSAKKYITVDGAKVYISECATLTTPIPYKEIGFKWVIEYNVANTSISALGVPDNVLIGSKQGVERSVLTNNGIRLRDGSYQYEINIGETEIFDKFDINTYSGRCPSATGYSYNGNKIDLGYSSQSSIKCDNFVDRVSSPPVCYNFCRHISFFTSECLSNSRICESSNNTLYYQRCTNYTCQVYKFIKKPVMQRKNGTEIVDNSRTLESKFTCGDGGLGNVVQYYSR